MCEGWSLEIGTAYRGSVVRCDTVGTPTIWQASVNTSHLGEYLEREAALRRVEASIEKDMQLVLHDWELFKAGQMEKVV